MHFAAEQDLQLLVILVALGGLLALAPTLRLPVPILLVLGGMVLGFVPGLPQVVLAPDVVLVALLPPLLYSAAFFTSLRDLRTNRRPIAFLAFGLVAATMGGRGRRGARVDRPVVAGGVHARRDRLADGRARRHRDRRAAGRAAPDRRR